MGTRNPIGGPFKRRVRRPLPLAMRRPVRWIEGNSSAGVEELPETTSFTLTPTLDTSLWPTAGGTELIFGDDDLDWMDKNEATIERVVGDISLVGFGLYDSPLNIVTQAYYRLGILVVEEVEDISTWVPPSLWDREAVEEYEWMWLKQGLLKPAFAPLVTADYRLWYNDELHLDLRVKRKMGKKDHLVILGQFGLGGTPLVGTVGFTCSHLLRVLFKI